MGCWASSPTPLEKLWEALERFPTVRDLPIGETRYTPRKAQAITGEAVRTIGAEQMDTSEQRRMRRALVRACEKLVHSAWGSIDLNSETGEQVRDFIIDEIIDRPELVRLLEVISAARMGFVARHVIVTPRPPATVCARRGQAWRHTARQLNDNEHPA